MLRLLVLCSVVFFHFQIAIGQPPSTESINTAREFFNEGVKQGINMNFEEAIGSFENAIELNPLFAEAFLYKGLAEIEMGNYQQALKDFTITIELDPEFSDQAHYFRGLTRYFMEEYDIAIEDFSVAIRMNPDFVSFYQRGRANLELGEYRRALQDFDIAIRLKEGFNEAYLYRGISLYYLKEYEDAMEDLEIAKAELPDNAEAHYYSGLVRLQIKNSYVAIEDLDRAIELNPKLSDAYEARAQARQNTGNQQAALQDRQAAMELKEEPKAVDLNQTQPTAGVAETQSQRSSTDIDFAGLFNSSQLREEDSNHTEPASPATIAEQPTAPVNTPDSENISATGAKPKIDELSSGFYNIDFEQHPMRGFGVQVASYSNTNNLENLANAYAEKYDQPVFLNVAVVNGRTLYKLIIGQFEARSDAEQFRDTLRQDDFPDSFLVVYENL